MSPSLSYQSQVLADGPVRFYPLSELSGTVAIDAGTQSVNANHVGGVTVGGDAATRDDGAGSAAYNGTSGYTDLITVPASGWPLTFECWFRTLSPNAGHLINYGSTATNNWAVWFGVSGGRVNIGVRVGSTFLRTAGATPVNGGWHHAVATFVNSTYRAIFVNGFLDAEQTDSRSFPAVNTASLAAWRRAEGLNELIPISLSGAAIYNKALSATRIREHYAAGLGLLFPSGGLPVGRLISGV